MEMLTMKIRKEAIATTTKPGKVMKSMMLTPGMWSRHVDRALICSL
jgi:hypothetical protein